LAPNEKLPSELHRHGQPVIVPVELAGANTTLEFHYLGNTSNLIRLENEAWKAGKCWRSLAGPAPDRTTTGLFTWPLFWEYEKLAEEADRVRAKFETKQSDVLHWILVVHSLGWRPATPGLKRSLGYRVDKYFWKRPPRL
jgi:hypothetical protein